MKKQIHPQYHHEALISCSCGASFKVGSTKEKVSIDICSACHPFYSGQDKMIDTAGRVDRFKARLEKKASQEPAKRSKK